MSKTAQLEARMAELVKEATDLQAAAKARPESDGWFTAEETEKATRIKADASKVKEDLEGARGKDSLVAEIGRIGEFMAKGSEDEPVTEGDVRTLKGTPNAFRKSWGEQFTESPHYKALISGVAGRDPEHAFDNLHVETPPVPLGKTNPLGSGSTGGGPLINVDERGLPDPVAVFQRPMTLRDLITVGRTNSNSIRYAQIAGFTNAATGVKEAATVTGTNAAGGLKPQSDLTTVAKTATVVTIAHWFSAAKQALSDAPYLQTLIDSYGRYGLMEEEEDQIIAGTGSANDQLEGFNTVSGMQTQTFSTDIFTTVRKAMTKIKKIGRARATGVLLNLEDNETLDLTRVNQGGGAGTGMWLGNGPWNLGPPTLWGVPRVESEAVPSAKCYVADFRTVVLLIREDPSMSMTDSHADYFVRNLVALLFEERATEFVMRPKAIVECATA